MKKRPDGRYCRKIKINNHFVFFYSSEKTAKQAVKDIERQLLEYKEKDRNGKTFNNVADEWNTEYREKVTDINYRKNTKAAYEYILKYFDDKYIKDISAIDIYTFIQLLIKRGYYKKTVANYKSIINMIFQYAVLNGYMKFNPVADIRLPNNLPQNKREIPTSEELKTISEHYNGFDLLPFFILYTGCRRSEALAIRDSDIDFENKLIKIRNHIIHDGNCPVFEPVLKTDAAERDIILLDKLIDVIPKDFKGFLFSMDGDGKEPLTKCAYSKRWTSYCKRYDLNVTAHQLRHGYATMLFEADIDVKDAQELMGHSDIALTRQIYTHIRNERKTETAKKLNTFAF